MKKRAIREMKRSMKNGAEFTMVFQAVYGEILMRHDKYRNLKAATTDTKQEKEDFYEGVSMIMRDLYPVATDIMDKVYENIYVGIIDVEVDRIFTVFERMIFNCLAREELFPPEMVRTIMQVGLMLNFVIKPMLVKEKINDSIAEDIVVAFLELMLSLKYCLEERYPREAE